MSYKHVISNSRLLILVICCALAYPLGAGLGAALATTQDPQAALLFALLIGADYYFILLVLKHYDKERESPH